MYIANNSPSLDTSCKNTFFQAVGCLFLLFFSTEQKKLHCNEYLLIISHAFGIAFQRSLPSMVGHGGSMLLISILERLKQEDRGFEAILSFVVTL